MRSIVYPTTECPEPHLYPVPRKSPHSVQAYVKVGCRSCEVCDEEKLKRKQDKWIERIRSMILYYQENGNRVVFLTLTLHNEDLYEHGWISRPDLPPGRVLNLSPTQRQECFDLLKKRLSVMWNALRMQVKRKYGTEVAADLKYWNVMELGGETKRPHAHVFLFLPKEIVYEPVWTWIKTYWKERYKAYILHSRLVDSAPLASWYASKYAVKQIGRKYDRVSGSQFGWVKFMERRKKAWLGLEDSSNGAVAWAAFRVEESSVRDALARNDIVGSLNALGRVKIEKIGKVDTDKPCLHPFGACWKDNRNLRRFLDTCNLEKLNQEECDLLTITPSLIWLPDTVRSLQLLQLQLERLSAEVERLLNS